MRVYARYYVRDHTCLALGWVRELSGKGNENMRVRDGYELIQDVSASVCEWRCGVCSYVCERVGLQANVCVTMFRSLFSCFASLSLYGLVLPHSLSLVFTIGMYCC